MSVSFSTVIQRLRARPNANTNLLNDFLGKVAPTVVTSLPNGFRVASEAGRGDFATIGVWIDAGSRYESRLNNGSAYLLQKIALNGTTTSSRSALATAIDELGGHMNAYTNRDRTAFYVKCLKDDVPKAVTLLAELIRNPMITDDSVEAQRKVVLSDLKDSEENQDNQVMDFLHTAAYDSTESGLGALPMGTVETVKTINAQSIENYKKDNWTASRMVLVGAGGIKHEQLESLARQHFGDLAQGSKPKLESRYVGGDIKFWNLRMKVSHIAWAFETCGAECGDVVPLTLVNHIYSRFHRSQHDITQHSSQLMLKSLTSMDHSTPTNTHFPEKGIELVNPFFNVYGDTGLLGMHIVCRPEQTGPGSMENMYGYVQFTMGELCRLTQKVCHPQELEQGKIFYKSQLLMNYDGSTNSAEDIAKQVLQVGRRVPLEEMFARIDDVTPTNIMETLQHYYYSRRPVLSYVGYNYQTPSYDIVSQWTYKFLY